MHPDLAVLLEHARADHRAEVQLGWQRQRFFVGVNAGLLAAGCALGSSAPVAALPVLALGAVLSLVGALVVARSHGRTRRTRDELDQAARRAGVEGPTITGGQRVLRGEARGEGYRVVVLVVVSLVVCGVLDGAAAGACMLRDRAQLRPTTVRAQLDCLTIAQRCDSSVRHATALSAPSIHSPHEPINAPLAALEAPPKCLQTRGESGQKRED